VAAFWGLKVIAFLSFSNCSNESTLLGDEIETDAL
jgi:hypothetical protein